MVARWLVAGVVVVGVTATGLSLHGRRDLGRVRAVGVAPFVQLRVVAGDAGVVPDAASVPVGCHAADSSLARWRPDPTCTPGAISDRVTQANIRSTICVPGYTGTVRPPQAVTGPLKRKLVAAYGMSGTLELDHLVPLALGGANSVFNLAPEPSTGSGLRISNPKDKVEKALAKAVCRRNRPVPLAVAQAAIAADWTTARQVVG